MTISELNGDFSSGAVQLVSAVATSRTGRNSFGLVGESDLIRYIAGVLPADQAQAVEASAVASASIRKELTKSLAEVDRLVNTPYIELNKLIHGTGTAPEAVRQWTLIVENHVRMVSDHLAGSSPITWAGLCRLAKQGADGYLAARTNWRAFFAPTNTSSPSGIRLGFGYRRGASGFVDSMQQFTRIEGIIRESGDLEVFAEAKPGTLDQAVFLTFSQQGIAFPLCEDYLRSGQVRLTVEGLGSFLRLPVGAVPPQALSARLGDWPEGCALGQILVQPYQSVSPTVEPPTVVDRKLQLKSYFEDTQLEGQWELLLAVTPNCWQILAIFDIKCEFGRSQVLSAELPVTAREGSFGGALMLRRRLSQ